MGADIHVYPEYEVREGYWGGLCGRSNPGRDYDLFGKIAGVRRDGQMFDPRGFPGDAGYIAKGDNHIFIHKDGGEGYATPEDAERWVTSGISHYTDETKRWVTDPDAHSHTWLTPAEFRAVLEAPREGGWSIDEPYWGLLAMIEEIERRGKRARLVIWFDN